MTTTEPSAAGLLAAAAGTWKLDPSASNVMLHTKAMWGLAKVKAGFTVLEGSGTVGEDGTVTGSLVIDAASVNTKNKKRDTHLRSEDFFEVTTYPTFTFTATGVRPAAGDEVRVLGTLTVHGQTRPLEVPARVAQDARGRVTITAEVAIDRSEWGISWAKLGAKLDNTVIVTALFTKVG